MSEALTVSVEHLRAFGFRDALRGMRNAKKSWGRSDTTEVWDPKLELLVPTVGLNDLKLAMDLCKKGSVHAKLRRQIVVWYDLIAPWLFWKEYETYQIGTTENSESQMHTMGDRFLTQDDFMFDSWGEEELRTLSYVNTLIKAWWETGKKKPSKEWRKIMQSIPGSYVYRRTCTLNYEVLTNMYRWRRNHKLQEWRDFLTILEEGLPYSQFWTLKGVA